MAIVEDISDDEAGHERADSEVGVGVEAQMLAEPRSYPDKAGGVQDGPLPRTMTSSGELLSAVEALTKQLKLPQELVPGFMASSDQAILTGYQSTASRLIRGVAELVKDGHWDEVSSEAQMRVMDNVLRLYGEDEWSSADIRGIISEIIPHLSTSLPLLILPSLRQYFAPHPSLSSASRAIRPANGVDSTIDLHDSQPFKSPDSWGVVNLLSYAVTSLAGPDVEKHIGLIVPPTLALMDDWEPSYRLKGARILDGWMGKLDPITIRRMGLDSLLLKSLLHTLSLNSNPPLPGVLEITLRLIERVTDKGEERTNLYAEVVENGIVQGWTYAPSGIEGREVLVHIAGMMEVMCGVLGSGVVRWLKTIIPQLLQPLQYPPSPTVLRHYRANLSCLLRVMRTVRETGRVGRWRGMIMNVLCRLWVEVKERNLLLDDQREGENNGEYLIRTSLHAKGSTDIIPPRSADTQPAQSTSQPQPSTLQVESLIKEIFDELSLQIPSVRTDEYPRLLKVAPAIFSDLVSPLMQVTNGPTTVD